MELKGFITNLGKYNEGELIGEWATFPIYADEEEELMKRIGIDGVYYEEYFITDYDGDIGELHDYLGEYTSIDDLNELAEALDNIDDYDEDLVKAALYAHGASDIQELIRLLENISDYYLVGVSTEEDLGYYIVDEIYGGELDKNTLENYFDYKKFGRDAAISDFTETPYGYISN